MPETNMNEAQNLPETWEELFEAYNKELAAVPVLPGPGFSNPRLGDYLDENRTIRWNCEEVERLRAEYADEAMRLNKLRYQIIRKMDETAIKMVARDTGLSERKAERLWDFVYEKYAYSDLDLRLHIEEMIELVNDLLKEDE